MFSVKFLSHYLILLLPPWKLLKEGKYRIILFFEWIKALLKILALNDPLQTTRARTWLPDTNCLIPWFPSPHWLKVIAFLLRELSLPSSVGDVSQSAAAPGPTIFKWTTQSLIRQSFHWVYLVASYLPPPTTILKINFYSEIMHFFIAIICFHLTVLAPNKKGKYYIKHRKHCLKQSFNLQPVVCHVIASWIMFGKPRAYFVICMYN